MKMPWTKTRERLERLERLERFSIADIVDRLKNDCAVIMANDGQTIHGCDIKTPPNKTGILILGTHAMISACRLNVRGTRAKRGSISDSEVACRSP